MSLLPYDHTSTDSLQFTNIDESVPVCLVQELYSTWYTILSQVGMISDLRSRIKWQNVNDVAIRQTDYGTVQSRV